MNANDHGLPAALLQAGLLSPEKADALCSAATDNTPFIDLLLQDGALSARSLALFCARHYGYPFEELSAPAPETRSLPFSDHKLLQRHRILPLRLQGRRLTVAISDPSATDALAQIRFQTQLLVDPVVVEHPRLLQMIASHAQEAPDTATSSERTAAAPASTSRPEDDAPVVRYLHTILEEAIRLGASDLHLEPFEHLCRIRVRVDGVLRDLDPPPLALKDNLASRIKVLARLDIAEKRVPQDGRMRLTMEGKAPVDFRVSTLPTLFGEKIVLRLLNTGAVDIAIDTLGYEPQQQQLLLAALRQPHGMIVMTGPTGSGKTVSLYACLNILNRPESNISTIEDPVEIHLNGINQVNVNERAGLSFAVALRAFLRQDPDVIMIGEIRDLETADIAVKAAQTGHLVLSTLHTNDAPSTLTRLRNMGMAPFNIASAVTLITAQRLARRLCQCKQPVTLPKALLLQAGFPPAECDDAWQAYAAAGCKVCSGSGYRGRVGIYQVMPVSAAMENLILASATTSQIAAQAASEGITSLRQAGLLKMRQGLTSLEEVLACTPP
ncbi:type IV-A pilus assembly ATPase PilB [Herbaspirillum sp. RTI4]|uniref:type IV-A pilus assembly ATPase PilB n=1 Tax=Herbaspirillum sp. RTI4 TaxID=3048640 RepID=UPI002AB59805|nr:type IV-A pilus assembly ATPase PilB [Herbaspirillum sp. RTI4]MDY7577498.1 type IV-A pilus assembly ATPase PilB [Herbaspirillum sp. RTI4]MEA9980973.1 type IV-A pilus assembly ATPase PilB [Herbaspirillum sp. RTI4]